MTWFRFVPLLVACACLLAIVALVAAGEWKRRYAELCSRILLPKTYASDTGQIRSVIRLARSFGSLAVYARSDSNDVSPKVLFVHGL